MTVFRALNTGIHPRSPLNPKLTSYPETISEVLQTARVDKRILEIFTTMDSLDLNISNKAILILTYILWAWLSFANKGKKCRANGPGSFEVMDIQIIFYETIVKNRLEVKGILGNSS